MGQREPARDASLSKVGLVHVEVVVTDPRHDPVTGLPVEAFRLTRNPRRPPASPVYRL
jgi:hypothetical protein